MTATKIARSAQKEDCLERLHLGSVELASVVALVATSVGIQKSDFRCRAAVQSLNGRRLGRHSTIWQAGKMDGGVRVTTFSLLQQMGICSHSQPFCVFTAPPELIHGF